jgi:hypothetical protein
MDVSCSAGQIHPLSVRAGTNVSSQHCPRSYLQGISSVDDLQGSYNDDICLKEELGLGQSYKYHEICIGQSHCYPNVTDRIEKSLSNCNRNMSSNFTTFMEMEYECIAGKLHIFFFYLNKKVFCLIEGGNGSDVSKCFVRVLMMKFVES